MFRTSPCTMRQHEQEVARVDVVLVSYQGGEKTPLTEAQRAQLLDAQV